MDLVINYEAIFHFIEYFSYKGSMKLLKRLAVAVDQ